MKKRILSLLLCATMIMSFTACGNKADSKVVANTEEAAAGTEEVAAGTEEAAAETQNEVSESRTGTFKDVATGVADGKTENDYKFSGVFGAVNPYSDPMQGAADQAASELGIPATEFNAPQDWVQNDQNTILDGLIAKGIKGIYMMPSDPVAGNEQISKMVDAGIPIVCVGGAPDQPSQATLTLATDVYQSAYDGTSNLIEAMGGKGQVVGLTGAVTDTNTQLRMDAIKDACDAHEGVELFQVIGDIDNSEGSVTAVENILAASGDEIGGFISTAYYPSVALATILADEKYSNIKAIGTDTDEKVLDGIRQGSLTGTMSQNPWGQAYLATVTLKMLTDGWSYKEGQDFLINSGSFYITKDNVENLDEFVKSETMKIAETWTDRFDAPVK